VILNRDYFTRTPKLLWRQTASQLIAVVDEIGIWFGRSIQAGTVSPKYAQLDYYYVLAVLNSAYLRYAYNRRVQEQGRVFPQVKFENLKPLPFPVVEKGKQTDTAQLVRRILAVKRKNPVADTSGLEREIDQLVYALYGLTPEEIEIVEGASTKP
jgi:hypothetical protein